MLRNARVKGADRRILRFTMEIRDGPDDSEVKRLRKIGRMNSARCFIRRKLALKQAAEQSQEIADVDGLECERTFTFRVIWSFRVSRPYRCPSVHPWSNRVLCNATLLIN